MLRMIDLMRTVCHWHESKHLAFKGDSGTPVAVEDQLETCDVDALPSRNTQTITRTDVQADMGAMMRNFNVDLNALQYHRDELLDAEHTCATCNTVGRCYRWKRKGGRGDAPELFCPNVGLFSELAVDPFWAKSERYGWPDDPTALPWMNLLGTGSKKAAHSPPDLGSDKLDAFAKAAVRIDRVAREWAPQIKRAGSPDSAEKLRRQADRDMTAAIEEADGIMLDDFRSIYHVALSDAAIAGEIKGLLEQRMAA